MTPTDEPEVRQEALPTVPPTLLAGMNGFDLYLLLCGGWNERLGDIAKNADYLSGIMAFLSTLHQAGVPIMEHFAPIIKGEQPDADTTVQTQGA